MCCMYTVYSGMQEWVIQIPSIPILVSVLFPSLHLKYFRIKFLLLVLFYDLHDSSNNNFLVVIVACQLYLAEEGKKARTLIRNGTVEYIHNDHHRSGPEFLATRLAAVRGAIERYCILVAVDF